MESMDNTSVNNDSFGVNGTGSGDPARTFFLLYRSNCASHHGGDVGWRSKVRLVVSGLKSWLGIKKNLLVLLILSTFHQKSHQHLQAGEIA